MILAVGMGCKLDQRDTKCFGNAHFKHSKAPQGNIDMLTMVALPSKVLAKNRPDVSIFLRRASKVCCWNPVRF